MLQSHAVQTDAWFALYPMVCRVAVGVAKKKFGCCLLEVLILFGLTRSFSARSFTWHKQQRGA